MHCNVTVYYESEMAMSEQVLIVREIESREEIHRVSVDGRSERSIERVMLGMMINMREGLFIDDSEAYGGKEPTP